MFLKIPLIVAIAAVMSYLTATLLSYSVYSIAKSKSQVEGSGQEDARWQSSTTVLEALNSSLPAIADWETEAATALLEGEGEEVESVRTRIPLAELLNEEELSKISWLEKLELWAYPIQDKPGFARYRVRGKLADAGGEAILVVRLVSTVDNEEFQAEGQINPKSPATLDSLLWGDVIPEPAASHPVTIKCEIRMPSKKIESDEQ